jgi:hypothetical protein
VKIVKKTKRRTGSAGAAPAAPKVGSPATT